MPKEEYPNRRPNLAMFGTCIAMLMAVIYYEASFINKHRQDVVDIKKISENAFLVKDARAYNPKDPLQKLVAMDTISFTAYQPKNDSDELQHLLRHESIIKFLDNKQASITHESRNEISTDTVNIDLHL